MKNLIVVFSVVALFAMVFSGCKKEDVNLETPSITLDENNDFNDEFSSLNIDNNELSIKAMLPPDLVGDSVDVKITTDSDTIGFTLRAKTTVREYTDGNENVLYKSIYETIYIAGFTDADRKYIKINSDSEEVHVSIQDNLVSDSYPVDGREAISVTFWPTWSECTVFLYGRDFEGNESKSIEVWTTSDDTHITINGVFNDPTSYNAPPAFNNYTFTLTFVEGSSNQSQGEIGAADGDVVYIKYNGVTYNIPFRTSSSNPINL
jgi:hypothetical protein